MTERHSVQVLRECIDLQNKKANDYQNPNSTIKQADYYPSGCLTILEIIQAKVLRMRSVMEAMQYDPSYNPNFESLEDSAKDLINYASFFVAYSRGQVDGQDPKRDFLNRPLSQSLQTGLSGSSVGVFASEDLKLDPYAQILERQAMNAWDNPEFQHLVKANIEPYHPLANGALDL